MVSSFWYRLSTAMWMNTNPSIRKKNNEDQPEKYGNQLKMANPFYDSITARCSHIWITITAKDRHPWITAEVCHPRIMASCFRNWNLATVCTCNRITAEVCHPRIIAYCICNWNLTTVCILQSDDGESQLRFEHWRASFHAVQASKTTTLWLPKRRKRYGRFDWE